MFAQVGGGDFLLLHGIVVLWSIGRCRLSPAGHMIKLKPDIPSYSGVYAPSASFGDYLAVPLL
jgi:hypothetical protein